MNSEEWVSEDPVDRAWQLFRLAMEEGENRFGLYLTGWVANTGDFVNVYIGGPGYGYKGGFAVPKATPDPQPPVYRLEMDIYPLLMQFAEQRSSAVIDQGQPLDTAQEV